MAPEVRGAGGPYSSLVTVSARSLSGALLDFAVAKVLGVPLYLDDAGVLRHGTPAIDHWRPTTSWEQAGLLIELYVDHLYRYDADDWAAEIATLEHAVLHPSPCTAACLVIVLSRLGQCGTLLAPAALA